MKKLIVSTLIVVAAMGYNSAKAQNATGNASDARVPLTSPPPQAAGSGVTLSGVNTAAFSVPPAVAPPAVTAAAAPGVPPSPAAPTPPTSNTSAGGSNFSVRLNMPAANAPTTVPLAQRPDVRLSSNAAPSRAGARVGSN